MTTDGSGNVTGTNVLSPYGETLSSNTNDSFSYAGLTQDTEYGGDAASFRNYSREQTRWLRPDPYNGSYDLANPQSFNRYMYVSGNPLMYTDPSGQGSACVDGICVPWFPGVLNTVGSAVDIGLFAANFLNDVFGLWGQPPQFTGNMQASQSGKNVPQNNNACTADQKWGAELAKPFASASKTSGWIAFGAAIATAASAVGEEPTVGADTPVTITAGSVYSFFSTTSMVTGAGAAALNSFAGGSLVAVQNFGWGQLSDLAAKAAASKIPIVEPWSDTLGDLSEQASDLTGAAQEVCQ